MRLIRAGNQKNIRGRLNLQRLQPPAVSGASYLLDTYPAFAAYSTRLLKTGEVDCMDVRESSGNTVATIGFNAGWLDEAAVASHCGANNGFVTKWYDQSGNGYDVTQGTATRQPQIYNGSAVLKVNGQPALTKVNTSTQLVQPADISLQAQPYTIVSTSVPNTGYISMALNSTVEFYASGSYLVLESPSQIFGSASVTSQGVAIALGNGASSVLRYNGAQVQTGDAGSTGYSRSYMMSNASINDPCDSMQEYIVYNSDQTANFAAIETNINTAFSVYA